ncbi:hypothetical protein U0021_09005 [Moraxella canis]|uniref:Zeta toxin domain-containing protein n=1 Tax=Moraxella canis TaxID=90239 RepID=A0ABZ0WXV1_9GAMM|nr:hypothetical protein [Moraxella canis]WQE03860.1 hypothetical protein U0021_09005 [Moraxella canis]
MPLYENAIQTIKNNLQQLQNGERPKFVAIGYFTDEQFAKINEFRIANDLPPLEQNEILYMGRHHFESRVKKDGYKISDLIQQITNAISENSKVIITQRMTAIQNQTPRNDGYGNLVTDRAIFELTTKKPRAELFSVIPKGDNNKPPK